jgi:hypothetical protein
MCRVRVGQPSNNTATALLKCVTHVAQLLVLVAIIWASWLSPSWSQTPDPDVCIENGGTGECSSPDSSPFTYGVVDFAYSIGNLQSEQALYDAVVPFACTTTVTPGPPFAWTPTNFSGGTEVWTTPLVETGTAGHCDGGPTTPESLNWTGRRIQEFSCPAGWTYYPTLSTNYQFGYCVRPAIEHSQRNQCPQCVADPIDPADGNETEREIDYAGGGSTRLLFARTYNYAGTNFGPGQPNGAAGQGWSHTYE